MSTSHRPSANYAPQMPEPPSAANGWGRWVSSAVASIDARMLHLDRHAELTTEHIMELRERMAALEDDRETKQAAPVAPTPTPPPPARTPLERLKGLKDMAQILITGLVWLLTIVMAIAHALGLPWAEKLRGIVTAMGGGS